jgi:pilus assembly protein CpaC
VVLVTPHIVKPLAQGTAKLPTDAYVDPSNVEFYLFGCLEGKKKNKKSPEPPPGNVPAGFGRQPVQQ